MKYDPALERHYAKLSRELGLPAEILMHEAMTAFYGQWARDLPGGSEGRPRLRLAMRGPWLWRYFDVDPEAAPAAALDAAILASRTRGARTASGKAPDRHEEAAEPSDPCADCCPDEDVAREMCA